MRDRINTYPIRSALQKSVALIFFWVCGSTFLFAQWSSNPAENTRVCVNTSLKQMPEMVTDGKGGAIIAWRNSPPMSSTETRAQRLTSAGIIRWDSAGVVLNTNASSWPTLGDLRSVADHTGGAYTFWRGPGSFFYYGLSSQHVDSSGTTLWQQFGSGPAYSWSYDISTDDSGNILVARNMVATPPNSSSAIFTDYLVAFSENRLLGYPQLVSDGCGGTIVAFQAGDLIYAQRVDGNGTRLWHGDEIGSRVSDSTGSQFQPRIVKLPAAGSAIAWFDDKNRTRAVYVQRLDSTGTTLWGSKGVNVFESDSLVENLSMVAGNDGSVIVAFQTKTSQHGIDVIAQRLDVNGVPQWGQQEFSVCSANDDQMAPRMIPDGFGGAIIVWQDGRSGTNADVYAQRVTTFGVPLWGTNGVVVSNAFNDQLNPVVAPDGFGGAIIAWDDTRNGGRDIYAQVVGANGALPVQLASFSGFVMSNARVLLRWQTISEVNNFGFEVQRKAAGQGEFATLPNSFLAGHGTTIQPHDYEWMDVNAVAALLQYRLKQIDLDGAVHFSEPITVSTSTSVAQHSFVSTYALRQNYPNPFNPTTEIRCEIPYAGLVTLTVYDLVGREIATLVNERKDVGVFSVRFDASNLSSGTYIYRLTTGDYTAVKKMIVVK
ncbi:MAG: T9SS type A sorting domain-containing protein [Ignavibacteriae bacterium]|nr:T9SS type A sorting domain-containing protein [Ignavibacteriota bacterium]